MIGGIVVAERLVDKHKVETVGLKLAHGLYYRCARFVVAVFSHPDFGRQEKFLVSCDIPRKDAMLLNGAHLMISGSYAIRSLYRSVADMT